MQLSVNKPKNMVLLSSIHVMFFFRLRLFQSQQTMYT